MSPKDSRQADSHRQEGGTIPGSAGTPAFVLTAPQPSTIPVLIAVPHAGRAYPASIFEHMRNPGTAAVRLEDRYADELARRVADATGAALLVAQAPRAMIDLNRAPDDVDWDMFSRGRPDRLGSYEPGRRARSGLGLIPRRLPGLGEIWKRRHEESELEDRIQLIHQPYHMALSAELARLRERWGAALLLDLHSMPPLPKQGSSWPAEFVLGDRFGATCAGSLVASAFSYFSEMRRAIAHNRPYSGGYVLERHASPETELHAFQLEIDRTSYLDPHQSEPGAGFAAMVHLLTGLVRRLAGDVAELGRISRNMGGEWADAAE
ncbi:N-formylglutamate amidohydrolase [Novosphingobium sp. TH158]|uniref:N-formylglutamate amidohydrolase n=1 Tax=Novosphingobium sp. TH158 TaxID=2067455 RepID=UPI000C7A353D|nr:N-formylglutamate amidohydrolase [Novosphingobium sp. TH158]PLK24304.1 N-formylglutamate amidohydrolase [Novosphingobium sp. TH158]